MPKIRYVEAFVPTEIVTSLPSTAPIEAQPLTCFFRMECKNEADVLEKAKLAEEIAAQNGYTTYKIQKHIHAHPRGKCEVIKLKEVVDGVEV